MKTYQSNVNHKVTYSWIIVSDTSKIFIGEFFIRIMIKIKSHSLFVIYGIPSYTNTILVNNEILNIHFIRLLSRN